MNIRTIGNAALDLLYPPDLYCICCGKIIDSARTYRLCNDCMDGIKWISSRTCAKCGKRLADIDPGGVCFNCREHPHFFDRGYTCTEYGTHERALVFALKYDGRTDIAGTIGEIMYDRMTAEFDAEEIAERYDLVLPVPVHRHKRRIRGYNQAALIAESFTARICNAIRNNNISSDSKRLQDALRCDDSILVRTRETHMMRSLGPDARRENIRGAFGIREGRQSDIAGKKILLIDDIYTTGATVDEISSVLKAAGAFCVDILTFAAGADMVKS